MKEKKKHFIIWDIGEKVTTSRFLCGLDTDSPYTKNILDVTCKKCLKKSTYHVFLFKGNETELLND